MKNLVPVNMFHPSSPHKNQKVILDDPSRFKIVRAGRKFRKTSLGISWLFEQAILNPLTYPYIAPNRIQAKNIAWNDHVLRILNELNAKGVPYKKNEVELTVTFPHGGRVQLLGVENEEALRGISNWGGCVLDEYDDWEHDIWPLIIRPNLMVHKAPAIILGTPKGMRNMYRMAQNQKWKEFHFTSYDNPELDKDELNALANEYKKEGEDAYKQEILAEYVSGVGVVYKTWSTVNFKRAPFDMNLPLYVSFDWGVNDPTAILWIQPSVSDFRIIDAIEISDSNVETIISILRSKPYKTPIQYFGDPSGKARSLQTGTSVIEMLADKGIFVTTKDGVRIPDQIRKTKQNIHMTYVDSNLDHIRDCLLNYRYPVKKDTSLNQSNEIPIHDKWSHSMRALEYFFVNYTPIQTNTVVNNFDKWRI